MPRLPARPTWVTAASASSAAAPRRPVAISRPISSRSAVGPSTTATISPRYMTATRSDSSRTSSSSAETSRIAAPGIALGDDLAVDELDAADVEAAGRLIEDQGRQLAAELAGHDRLLLVPTRQRAGRDGRRRRPDVVFGDRLLGPGMDRAVVAHEATRVGRLVVLGQDQVVLERERQDEPESMAVARDEGHAGPLQRAGPVPRDVLAARA